MKVKLDLHRMPIVVKQAIVYGIKEKGVSSYLQFESKPVQPIFLCWISTQLRRSTSMLYIRLRRTKWNSKDISGSCYFKWSSHKLYIGIHHETHIGPLFCIHQLLAIDISYQFTTPTSCKQIKKWALQTVTTIFT